MRRIIILLGSVLIALAVMTTPAAASLCVSPGNASGASEAVHGDAVIAEAPPTPADFSDRGASLDNPAGKLAAWEAHFASDVVGGPVCD